MSQNIEKTIRCPFDPSHILSYNRFLPHLDKCKFPGKQHYLKCRFNPYHVLHKEDMSSHQANCPSRVHYDCIQDDEDEWWGGEEKNVEKSTVETSISARSGLFEMKQEEAAKVNKIEGVKMQDVVKGDFW